MSLVKKDLEIVYSLRWKNGPKREHKKQTSIVAVYDIPATTLNFADFKSYLLKNSGTAEQDVTVYYITDQGKEYPIQSQVDFQVVLYAFRRKARAGEVINLLLERKEDPSVHKSSRISNDVETQFDSMEPPTASEASSMCCNIETPPEWFIAALAQLKRDIKEEVAGIVANAVADIKPPRAAALPVLSQLNLVCPQRALRKPEKRLKKHGCHGAEHSDAKEIHRKSIKLEEKMEKLERKVSKYRERRYALQHGFKLGDHAAKSSDSDTGHTSSGSRCKSKKEKPKQVEEDSQQKSNEHLKMNAQPVDFQKSVPHMLGGEIYMHQWEVQNTGEVTWTSLTQLHYTWGSKLLVPTEKELAVPFLKPGEIGTISVRFHVPTQAGKYECYWHFIHNGRRFGQWLAVQVIVDPFDLKGHTSVLAKSNPIDTTANSPSGSRVNKRDSTENPNSAEALASIYKSLQGAKAGDEACASAVKAITEELVREVSNGVAELRLSPFSQSESGDDATQNKWSAGFEVLNSLSSSSSSLKGNVDEHGEPFVVPRCFVVDDRNEKPADIPLPTCTVVDESKVQRKDSVQSTDQTDYVIIPIVQEKPEEETAASSEQKSEGSAANFDSNNNAENAIASNCFKLRDEELDNIVVITVPKDEQIKEGFIYVHVDGQKVLIPKNILKSEVVSAAQELERSPDASTSVGVIIDSNDGSNKSTSPVRPSSSSPKPNNDDDHFGNTLDSVPPKNLAEPIIPRPAPTPDNNPVDLSTNMSRELPDMLQEEGADRSNYFEANNFMSHCSAAGSCFSEVNSQAENQSRVFVFPRDVPGYEVVYPVLNIEDPQYPNLTTETYVIPEVQPPTAPPSEGATFNPPNPFMEAVPNYQQTLPEMRRTPVVENISEPLNPTQESARAFYGASGTQPEERQRTEEPAGAQEDNVLPPQVHILPEMLVSGAVNAASSAFSTARSVFNNIIHPQAPGTWINGHWVSNNPTTPREANLQALAEMGFWNRDLNATLLARFNDDLNRVVAELVQ